MAEKWDRMLRSVEEQDIALIDADLHEDFMFVADYTLETREDWLATTKAEIRSREFKFSQPKLLLEKAYHDHFHLDHGPRYSSCDPEWYTFLRMQYRRLKTFF